MTARGDVRRAAMAVLLAAVAAQVSVSALQQGLPALGPILQTTFGLDTTATGALLGIGSLGTAIAVLGWGRLTDRWTDRRVAVLGLALTAAALVIAGIGAQIGSLTGTIAGLLFAGFAAAAPTVALTKSIARSFSPTRRMGLAFGIRQAAVPVGGATAGIVLPLLALRISLAAALWSLAALLVLAGIAVTRAVPGQRATSTTQELGPTPWRRIAPMLVSSALYTMAQIGIVALLTLYLVNARGWSPQAAGLAFAAVMAATVGVRVLVGFAADRWPDGRVKLFITTGLITAGLLLSAALLAPAPVTVVLLIAAGILGMGWNALAFTVTVSLVPESRIGTSQGVLNAMIFASWGAAPIVTGAAVQTWSWSAAWVMLAAFAIAGAVIAWVTMARRAPVDARRRT